jgi:hypothetical protein
MNNKQKKEETSEDNQVQTETQDEDKIQLSGFDLDEFKAKPLEPSSTRKKVIQTIPVVRPNKQLFFRAHKTMEYPAYILDWEEDRTSYLVHPKIAALIPNQVKFKILYVTIYSTGTVFLLPVPQPDNEGKWNNWHMTLSAAVMKSKKKWIRLEPDKTAQGYHTWEAEANYGEPEWPGLTIEQYLKIAFKNTQIVSEDHPKIKQLFGRA